MKTIFPIIYFALLLLIGKTYPAIQDTSATEYYNIGLTLLTQKDTTKAEYYFKKSLDRDKTAPALFELAKILISKKTIRDRARARELLESAIFMDPSNINYHLLMAALMEYFGSGLAFKEYEKILEIDSTNVTALFQLGRMKSDDFNEYYHSVFQDDPSSPMLSLDKFAMEDFEEAKHFFLKILNYDSTNSQALLHISILYENAGKAEKAVPLLERLVRLNPANEKAHLYLGLMYYKTSNLQGAYNEYKKALTLMKPEERRDFTYNSVKELIKPLLGDKIKDFSEANIENLIDIYWKARDPLYLTDYNERLLEHYSRVAYANLHFGVNRIGLKGWKSNRGEVWLRFGEPINRIRMRPQINAGGRADIKLKTDVWYYNDMVFGFTDNFFNGKYTFSEPSPGNRLHSQYGYDSHSYFDYVKKIRNEFYIPKYEGPKFSVPYNIVQFKNEDQNTTDLYVSYGLKSIDSLYNGNKFYYSHNIGLFFFDQFLRTISEKRTPIKYLPISDKIEIDDTSKYVINSLLMRVRSDSGSFAFEIMRDADKGVSSNHFPFTARHFSEIKLNMSDILLANEVTDADSNKQYPITRGSVNILPNPLSTFSNKDKIFIYYEIYNLTPDSNEVYNVEQKLTIRKKDDRSGISKVLNSFLNIFSLGKDERQVTLTTHYKFKEKNPPVYFQLDMNKYEPSEYLLILAIKDINSGKVIKSEKTLTWK